MAYEDGLAVATARECNADLIVTGSHGRTGLEHILLGGTTERVRISARGQGAKGAHPATCSTRLGR